jgi:hypothetical protein
MDLFFWFTVTVIILYFYTKRKKRQEKIIIMVNEKLISELKWNFRGVVHTIILTDISIAKKPRHRVGLGSEHGIMLKHFWLDGKLCNTDSFNAKNLSTNLPL